MHIPMTPARCAGLALACGAAALVAATLPARAAPLTTDVPAVAAGNAQGPAPFRFYGTTGSRVQQVYDRALFGNFAGVAREIQAFGLRAFPGAFPSAFFGTTLTLSDVVISLSTTSGGDEGPGVLSTSFASNVGTDATVVFSGPLTLMTTAIGTFDYLVTLQTPFVYDPGKGNLLLDVNVPVGATVGGTGLFGFLTFDTVNTLNDGIYSIVNINDGAASSGTASTAGAVTRFVSGEPLAVPSPGGLALFGLGVAMVGLIRRPHCRRAG